MTLSRTPGLVVERASTATRSPTPPTLGHARPVHEMLSRARAKGAGLDATFTEGDAADPPLQPGSFDVVLSRHVLWAMPDQPAALERWCGLLRPGGRLVLVEGFWFTGAGLRAAEAEALVRGRGRASVVRPLTDPAFWGREITDERYLLVSR